MKKATAALGLLLCLAGCATQPASEPAAAAPAPSQTDSSTPAPSRNFAADSLYQLLVGELAGQRDQLPRALAHYSQQAQLTASPKVAERAWQIADYMGERQAAISSAQIWVETAPDSADAQRALALELVHAQRFEESLQHMERAFQLDPDSERQLDFINVAARSTHSNKQRALLQELEQLQKAHPEQVFLPLSRAILLHDEQPQQALALLEAMPGSDNNLSVLLMKARLYQQLEQPHQATRNLRLALKLYPDSSEARRTLAHLLFRQKQHLPARTEFLQLLQDEPYDDSHRLALAYINMELEAWDEAIFYLQELILRDSYTSNAYLNLGRCQEASGQPEAALQSYQAVEPGEHYLEAQFRMGELLLSQQDTDAFSQAMHQARLHSPEQANSLWLMDQGLLMQFQHKELAWQRIQQALQAMPDDPDLLYNRAMLAEQRGDLQQLENDLRAILQEDPTNAMALNALGYTLADRTQRYEEALQLIQLAQQLQPEDYATMDSLGWVYFRMGQPDLALPWLQQAHEQRPDPEVAAHLGEVLWTLGQRRQARKVWRAAYQQDPKHQVLLDTLQRLTGHQQRP